MPQKIITYDLPEGESLVLGFDIEADLRQHTVSCLLDPVFLDVDPVLVEEKPGQNVDSTYSFQTTVVDTKPGTYQVKALINLGEEYEEVVWPSRFDQPFFVLVVREDHLMP